MVQRFALSALFAALTTSVHAADFAPVSGSASLTGLSYHLVDLDPNDGITPWIQFNESYVGAGAILANWPVGVEPSGEYQRLNGDLFSATPANFVSSNGAVSASYSPTETAVRTQLTMAALNQLADQANALKGGDNQSVGANAAGLAGMAYGTQGMVETPGVLFPDDIDDSAFTLSANTALVIDGQWHVSATLDLTKLETGSFIAGIQSNAFGARFNVAVLAGAAMQLDGQDDLLIDYNYIDANQNIDGNGLGELTVQRLLDGADMPFSLQVSNTSTESVKGSLILGVMTMQEVDLSVASVPEPATWALMALGLVGVASATRRRSA